MVELGKKYSLDLGSQAPVEVIPREFTKEGIMCEYVNSTPERVELLSYNLFIINGHYKN